MRLTLPAKPDPTIGFAQATVTVSRTAWPASRSPGRGSFVVRLGEIGVAWIALALNRPGSTGPARVRPPLRLDCLLQLPLAPGASLGIPRCRLPSVALLAARHVRHLPTCVSGAQKRVGPGSDPWSHASTEATTTAAGLDRPASSDRADASAWFCDDQERRRSDMRCSACGHANRPDTTFCGECGTRLAGTVACARCGRENPVGRRFCDTCGEPLAGGGSPRREAPSFPGGTRSAL